MSSTSSSPIASLPIRSGRCIDTSSLPLSSDGSSQNANIDTIQSTSSPGVSKSDPVAIPTTKVDGATTTQHLSPKPFMFGQNSQTNQLHAENALFTFRSLHNASPQPPMMFAKPLKSPSSSYDASPSGTSSGQVPDNHKADKVQRKLFNLKSSNNLVH